MIHSAFATLRSFCLLLSLFVSRDYVYAQPADTVLPAREGTVCKSLSMYSKLAREHLLYSIYLPPQYDQQDQRFPVLFLLHGLGGNENSWINDFSIHRKADSLIGAGILYPLIIVMPDGRNSYYINSVNEGFPYETIFRNEFVPFIDSNYKTLNSREFRALAGLSMGGYGAVVQGMKNPDLFSLVIAFSAAIRTDSMLTNEQNAKYHQFFKPLYGDSLSGSHRITGHWIRNNPLYMVSNQPEKLCSIAWYLDCGLSDYLLPGNEALHDSFVRYRIPHEFHLRAGGHERAYWESGIVPALLFANDVFIHLGLTY